MPESADVDVVVVGGGIQGLLVLDALLDRRYSCALVTAGDLGSGQTLHSHGLLNTGFGLAGPVLPRTAEEVVKPYLRTRGVELGGEAAVIPPPGFPAPPGDQPAELPDGFAPQLAARAVRTADRTIPKRALVETLARGRIDRVIRGSAMLRMTGETVSAVEVDAGDGREISLTTRAVVVAAGCGTKRLLSSTAGPTPQLERIQHRPVQMICVRAPRGALPATSLTAMPLGLMVVAHEGAEHVLWYVTPMVLGGPSFDDVPGGAAAEVDPGMVDRGLSALLTLYPRLAEVDGVAIGCYAGWRQDVGAMPAVPMCELVEGTANAVVALPSGLVGPWVNLPRVVELVGALAEPRATHAALPCGGEGVRVGGATEEAAGFEWSTEALTARR